MQQVGDGANLLIDLLDHRRILDNGDRFPKSHSDATMPCSGLIHAEEFTHDQVVTERGIIYRCDACQKEF
jgi:hypothetical protein